MSCFSWSFRIIYGKCAYCRCMCINETLWKTVDIAVFYIYIWYWIRGACVKCNLVMNHSWHQIHLWPMAQLHRGPRTIRAVKHSQPWRDLRKQKILRFATGIHSGSGSPWFRPGRVAGTGDRVTDWKRCQLRMIRALRPLRALWQPRQQRQLKNQVQGSPTRTGSHPLHMMVWTQSQHSLFGNGMFDCGSMRQMFLNTRGASRSCGFWLVQHV